MPRPERKEKSEYRLSMLERKIHSFTSRVMTIVSVQPADVKIAQVPSVRAPRARRRGALYVIGVGERDIHLMRVLVARSRQMCDSQHGVCVDVGSDEHTASAVLKFCGLRLIDVNGRSEQSE